MRLKLTERQAALLRRIVRDGEGYIDPAIAKQLEKKKLVWCDQEITYRYEWNRRVKGSGTKRCDPRPEAVRFFAEQDAALSEVAELHASY